jgi:ubiquinone/menaquinone biosynthesis C-methylase UbiE
MVLLQSHLHFMQRDGLSWNLFSIRRLFQIPLKSAGVSVAQTDARQAVLEYRYRASTPGGDLLIRPMAEEHLPPTTELLTDSFSEAMGYMPVYRCVCNG